MKTGRGYDGQDYSQLRSAFFKEPNYSWNMTRDTNNVVTYLLRPPDYFKVVQGANYTRKGFRQEAEADGVKLL